MKDNKNHLNAGLLALTASLLVGLTLVPGVSASAYTIAVVPEGVAPCDEPVIYGPGGTGDQVLCVFVSGAQVEPAKLYYRDAEAVAEAACQFSQGPIDLSDWTPVTLSTGLNQFRMENVDPLGTTTVFCLVVAHEVDEDTFVPLSDPVIIPVA